MNARDRLRLLAKYLFVVYGQGLDVDPVPDRAVVEARWDKLNSRKRRGLWLADAAVVMAALETAHTSRERRALLAKYLFVVYTQGGDASNDPVPDRAFVEERWAEEERWLRKKKNVWLTDAAVVLAALEMDR